AEKRAHHNALERKRRDHIKDRFNSLKEAIPSIRHEKSVNRVKLLLGVSRAQILKKAAEYIQHMKEQHSNYNLAIETLKRQNALLESQCQYIESKQYLGSKQYIGSK
ncbi:hypothetical protein AAG570_009176, partial [Ranatra chinensis]